MRLPQQELGPASTTHAGALADPKRAGNPSIMLYLAGCTPAEAPAPGCNQPPQTVILNAAEPSAKRIVPRGQSDLALADRGSRIADRGPISAELPKGEPNSRFFWCAALPRCGNPIAKNAAPPEGRRRYVRFSSKPAISACPFSLATSAAVFPASFASARSAPCRSSNSTIARSPFCAAA
jgi:hypothetical protein